METHSTFIDKLDSFGYLIIGANLLLMLFARVILKKVYHQPENISNISRKIMIFRAFNKFIILAYGYFCFFQDKTNKTFLINVMRSWQLSILPTHYQSRSINLN